MNRKCEIGLIIDNKQNEIDFFQYCLEEAIREENYEYCAKLRDQIKQLE